jgi:transcriptional regulator GlxA family with amidase domain
MAESVKPISICLFASQYTSASGLFGIYDTLSSVGAGWEAFVSGEAVEPRFVVKVVAPTNRPFRCGSGVMVTPDASIDEVSETDICVLTGINASAMQPLGSAESRVYDWLTELQGRSVRVVSACTAALYLAEAGLLDDVEATTHWAYGDLFRTHYPKVRLRLEKNLCFTDSHRGVVTSGGTTAWQELALFLITNYAGMEQAVRAAKFWLLADHGSLQSPFVAMPLGIPHGDSAIQACQVWIADNYAAENPVSAMVAHSGLAPTTFARRFRQATGYTPKHYVQAVRVEEAKQLLESSDAPVEQIGMEVGYEDAASFRRLFKRTTGLTPAEHRRMFGRKRFDRYS